MYFAATRKCYTVLQLATYSQSIPSTIFSNTITLASSRHPYNTRFSAKCNVSRPMREPILELKPLFTLYKSGRPLMIKLNNQIRFPYLRKHSQSLLSFHFTNARINRSVIHAYVET